MPPSISERRNDHCKSPAGMAWTISTGLLPHSAVRSSRSSHLHAPAGPRRLDLAWFTTETNEVGLHKFAPRPGERGVMEAGRLEIALRPLSWNVIRLKRKDPSAKGATA